VRHGHHHGLIGSVDRGAFLRLDDDHAHRRLAGVVAGTDLEGLGLVHA